MIVRRRNCHIEAVCGVLYDTTLQTVASFHAMSYYNQAPDLLLSRGHRDQAVWNARGHGPGRTALLRYDNHPQSNSRVLHITVLNNQMLLFVPIVSFLKETRYSWNSK